MTETPDEKQAETRGPFDYDAAKYAHIIAADLMGGIEPPDQHAQRIEDALRAAYRAGRARVPLVPELPCRTVTRPCAYCGAPPWEPCRSEPDTAHPDPSPAGGDAEAGR